jgi:hypothetical protein
MSKPIILKSKHSLVLLRRAWIHFVCCESPVAPLFTNNQSLIPRASTTALVTSRYYRARAWG